jgi:hypothetical protein
MSRFYGKVGYGVSQENSTGSGVWVNTITEFPYFGDVIRNTRSIETGENLNSNISVGNSISIVADEYARAHFFDIEYIWWQGHPWTVTNVEVKHPRLILSLGKIYNGPFPEVEI